MKPAKKAFKTMRRALLLSGVVNVCALSWIAYCGLLQPSVQIVVTQMDETLTLTMEERLESMSLCDAEVLKSVLASDDSADLEEKVAAAYLLLKKCVTEKKVKPEVIAAAPQVVRPPRRETPINANLYLVQQGDSLWKIARKHQTDVNTIKELNSLKEDRLHPGKIIKLPS